MSPKDPFEGIGQENSAYICIYLCVCVCRETTEKEIELENVYAYIYISYIPIYILISAIS